MLTSFNKLFIVTNFFSTKAKQSENILKICIWKSNKINSCH